MNIKPVIFLDRDGIINKKRNDYVKNIKEFEFLPNVFEAIKRMNDLGFKIIIITNQSVVNRQIISEEELEGIHKHMMSEFKEKSCEILKIYYCPHRPNENCNCRKPNVGMIQQAVKDLDIDLSNSLLIGDSDSDIEAAKKMKIKSIKMKTNQSLIELIDDIKQIFFKETK